MSLSEKFSTTPVALLIGFKYNREFKELPGIIVDLYHAYAYSKKINATVHIMTDIINDENVNLLKNAVFDGVVKSDIISFITDIKQNGEHIPYIEIDSFKQDISCLVKNTQKLFFYYTGHGLHDYLVLPKFNKLSTIELRDILLFNLSSNAEIFSIMDCCNGTNLGIPFSLKSGDYRLIDRRGRIFPKQDIIHIVSSQEYENSAITGQGSIFTAEIFRFLSAGCRDIKHLVNSVSKKCFSLYPQTASLYVSRPNIYTSWRWLVFNDDNDIIVSYSPSKHCLTIQLKQPDDTNNFEICYNYDFYSTLTF